MWSAIVFFLILSPLIFCGGEYKLCWRTEMGHLPRLHAFSLSLLSPFSLHSASSSLALPSYWTHSLLKWLLGYTEDQVKVGLNRKEMEMLHVLAWFKALHLHYLGKLFLSDRASLEDYIWIRSKTLKAYKVCTYLLCLLGNIVRWCLLKILDSYFYGT